MTAFKSQRAGGPARIVAGDDYDLLELPDDKLALCIGDVVGKGMPAALMMANLQAAVKALASGVPAPQMLCQELNRRMAGNISLGKFIPSFLRRAGYHTRKIREYSKTLFTILQFWFAAMYRTRRVYSAVSCAWPIA